jgi:hypothetical protein
LQKIKDGGAPIGVLANTAQRMLKMCELAEDALAQIQAVLEGKE